MTCQFVLVRTLSLKLKNILIGQRLTRMDNSPYETNNFSARQQFFRDLTFLS